MTFSALLIGNEILTTQCGDILLSRGHGIAAVVTRSGFGPRSAYCRSA